MSVQLQPPDAFSNGLAQWVRDKCTQSVVFVELRPKSSRKVKTLWDQASPIKETDSVGEQLHQSRVEESRKIQCCTGFVVEGLDESIWILTCAHVLGPAFSTTYAIDAAGVNEVYSAMILCDHQEQVYQQEMKYNEDQERIYMKAKVVNISGPKDLMLLRVSGKEVQNCPHPHPPIKMANSFPESLVQVVMLSWPPGGDRTAVQGNIVHHCRPYSSLSFENPQGYCMKLSQVDMRSEIGSSGAPLLNGAGDYAGVLHGGNETFSFFISFEDLVTTLKNWEII